jgi:hypothetical protein
MTAATGLAPVTPEAKALATLQAKFALQSTELVRLPDGSFVASRWNLVKSLATFEEAERFLQQIGGARA